MPPDGGLFTSAGRLPWVGKVAMKARLYFAFASLHRAYRLDVHAKNMRFRPDQVDSQKALERATALARAERDKIDLRSLAPPTGETNIWGKQEKFVGLLVIREHSVLMVLRPIMMLDPIGRRIIRSALICNFILCAVLVLALVVRHVA